MLRNRYETIISFFKKGNQRTQKIKINILGSTFLRIYGVLINFILIPIVLDYLDSENYGIWLILFSFSNWILFFDVGFGNGLRNELAVAFANKNYIDGKKLVSSTYFSILLLGSAILVAFFTVHNFINWSTVFSTSIDSSIIDQSFSLAIIFFVMQFVFKLIGNVLLADQLPAINNIFVPLSNTISFFAILVVKHSLQPSLIVVTSILSISPTIVYFTANIFLFSKKYKKIAPSIKFIRIEKIKRLLNLGSQFFLIQISGLILYQFSNLIISHYFGPSEVTSYYVAYKYFSIITIIYTILISPYWSAFTEAWEVKDYSWIRNSIKMNLKIWGLLLLLGIVMLLFSSKIYFYWIGKDLNISFSLSLFLMIYSVLLSFGGIFNMFINGTGNIKLQVIGKTVGAIIFLPIVYILITQLNLGPIALVIGMIIGDFFVPFIAPVQAYLILKNNNINLFKS